MDKDKVNNFFGEDACITILFSEYKELLIIKGKYEELSKEKSTITWNPPITQPYTTPYPQDLNPTRYPVVTYGLSTKKEMQE